MTGPNILLVMADQFTPFLCGAYGHPVVKTPHLDALAARSVRFDAAYSPAPVCSPARACLLTGTHTSTNGVYDNAALWPTDLPAIGHYLTNAGYDCVLSGKMHFVGADQLHGFHRRLTTDIYPEEFVWVERLSPWVHDGPAAFDPERGRGNHAANYRGDGIRVDEWHHHLAYDEETHLRALEYLRAKGSERRGAARAGRQAETGQAEESAPFFLCVSYHHPHEPFWPPQELWDLYEGAEIEVPDLPDDLDARYSAMDRWLNAAHGLHRHDVRDPESMRRVRRAYYALVMYVDHKVGELMATLRRQGLWDDTVVLFTSDHGDMLCEKGMVQKRSFYEWSARVPLLLRLPRDVAAGTTCDAPVTLVDVLPTLLDVAGVSDSGRIALEGRSLLELLPDASGADGATDVSGASGALRSSAANRTAHGENVSDGVASPCFMVRRGTYKYIYIHGEAPQLFDLSTDPDEWQNLAADPAHATIAAELRALILRRVSPDEIQAEARSSLVRRRLINEAMRRNGTTWEYTPRFDARLDATRQYLPTGRPERASEPPRVR